MKVSLIKGIKLTFRSKFFSSPFQSDSGPRASAEDFFHLIFIGNALQICYVLPHNHITNHRIKIHKKKLKITLCKNLSADIFVYFVGLSNRTLARNNRQQRRPRSFGFVLFIFSVLKIKFESWNLKWNQTTSNFCAWNFELLSFIGWFERKNIHPSSKFR